MSVAADVVEHLLGSAEGGLGVDDPFARLEGGEVEAELVGIAQFLKRAEELELAGVKGVLEILEKQAAEQIGQHFDRQEEARSAGDPSLAVPRGSAAGNDAVQMGMEGANKRTDRMRET